MIRKVAGILLALLLWPSLTQSQSNPDSLMNSLDDASPDERVRIFIDISEIYWQRSYDTSLLMATHALNVAEKIDNKELRSSALNMMGIAYYLMADFASCMDYYFQSLRLSEELEDSISIAISFNNIGAVYIDLKDYQQALAYLKNAQDIFNLIKDETYMFSILNNIGTAYIDLELYDTAYQYLTDAYAFAQLTGNRIDASIALNNLGEVTLKMGLLDKSESFLNNALNISADLGDKAMMATLIANLGNLYLQKKEFSKAYDHFMRGLVYAEEVNSLPDKREIYKYLAEYYESMQDQGKSLAYYKLYNVARDSILSEQALMKIRQLEIKSNSQALQQEITVLKMENEINSLRQTRMRIMLFFVAALAIMGLLVFLIYFQKNRYKRETNKILEEQNNLLEKTNKKLQESEVHLKELNSTKDKFFSIIGHDLRNPLNALLGFSELISGNSREYTVEEIQKYTKIINDAAKNIHLLIENLLEWSRSQSGNIDFNPEETPIFPVLEEILKVFHIQAEKKSIRFETAVPNTTLAYTDRNLLSTILRNLVNNAVKFTPKGGRIKISSKSSEKELTLSVKDTGVGMSAELIEQLFNFSSSVSMPGTTDEKGTGLGLILCKEFLDMHGGKIWVESKPGKGSIFSFTLPLPK